MKYGLLLIALFMAATAVNSGEYSSDYGAFFGNTTTPKATTPAPTPNTTTHSPNTTTHSPNTTTHSPNTTTPAPTTVPMPTSPTNLTIGNYNVSDDKGICIMLDIAITIRVNNSKANGTYIVLPSKTHASGECSTNINIMLNFADGDITFKFKKDTKKIFVQFVEYDLNYAFSDKVLSNLSGKNESLELFSVDLGHSYSCKAETVDMGNGVSLDLTQLRMQALEIKNDAFGPPDLCKADQPDYRVPIAVGIILIILIIIVVIAYLISRKRRTDGYQSL